MPIRGLDAVSGQPIYLETAQGDGSEQSPYRLGRADVTAHQKLDEIKTAIAAQSAAWTPISNFGVNTSGVVKAGAGKLFGGYIINNSANTPYYLQLFDRTDVPPAGNSQFKITPFLIYPGSFAFGKTDLGDGGLNFNTGIAYGLSTALNAFTAGAATDIWITLFYS
jgi:hypothetical protein